jgi:hypothetical protein
MIARTKPRKESWRFIRVESSMESKAMTGQTALSAKPSFSKQVMFTCYDRLSQYSRIISRTENLLLEDAEYWPDGRWKTSNNLSCFWDLDDILDIVRVSDESLVLYDELLNSERVKGVSHSTRMSELRQRERKFSFNLTADTRGMDNLG